MFGLKTPIFVMATTILLAAPAEATTTYYVGAAAETTFNTAVAGLTLLNPTLTFSNGDLSPGVGLLNASGTGIDFLGFIFGSPADFTVNAGKLTGTDASEIARINFPALPQILAFGFHITYSGNFTNRTWCISATAAGCDNTVFNSTAASVQFFGIVSDAPITAPLFIRAQSTAALMVLPDFKAFGASQASEVPEPHTVLLVGLGLAILPLARWKLRKPA